MESALAHARKYLAASHPEDHREIVAVRYIPPHGDSTVAGYWLVELAPYLPTAELPATTLNGLLVEVGGIIRERGRRQLIDPAETERTRQHAEQLGEMMKAAKERRAKSETSPAP